jgi:hypothetical protein
MPMLPRTDAAEACFEAMKMGILTAEGYVDWTETTPKHGQYSIGASSWGVIAVIRPAELAAHLAGCRGLGSD